MVYLEEHNSSKYKGHGPLEVWWPTNINTNNGVVSHYNLIWHGTRYLMKQAFKEKDMSFK